MMSEVIIARESGVGRITLNRPKALHALNRVMCEAMSAALLDWRDDAAIKAVIIDHVPGTRGFCAGGDVVMIAESGAGDGVEAEAFFLAEYRLNHLLFSYPKPLLAIMDGITMGGGVGIALPCDYRVATENTKFAMPETGIGLFPDVGGGWYLPRLPGRIGEFMALTGARLDGAECKYLGLATHYVISEDVPGLVARIASAPTRIAGSLGAFEATLPKVRLAENETAIHKHFAPDVLEEILDSLDRDESDWARTEAATIRTKSPLSCKVSLRLMAEGKQRTDFAAEMAAEYALACRVARTHDFQEGVRALLVDKDNAPQWDPPEPERIDEAMLDALFAARAAGEQWTPFGGVK